ncbi:ABC transporter permease [Pseudotabrizicola sp.]|uniref:ABC transporter permease n=2 Tax=Pseudotabrizicola sp. TaxID=2939647 RepID=UPI002731FF36|nr:ABC transporter permease [Pseudotabrizicola sp.]
MRARKYRMGRTISALMLREMATSYGRSPGGYVWEILEPTLALAIMTALFSAFITTPPIGDNFPLFFATGFLPFMLFNDTANRMATAINFSRPLLAYPSVTFLDAMLARLILHTLTNTLVSIIVFSFIIFVLGATVRLDMATIALAYGLAVALGFGIGSLNSYLMTSFPLWERAWQIATRPLFLISGVFMTFDSLPEFGQEILIWNPLVHIVGLTRAGFFANYSADYVSVTFVLLIALTTAVFGLMLLYRHHRSLLEA